MIETSDMQFEERMVTPREVEEDREAEVTLRPQTLVEYIGQDKVKENLAVYIEAAKRRGDPLDHVLLYGPPGLGKTTLSSIIAHEMGVNLRVTTGPAIEKAGDLAAILTNLQPNDVLFIDEIHRLNRQVEEILYPALEDHAIDIIMGKGPSARSLRVDLNPFTLVGATTRAGQLSSPLRDRFGVILRLELYTTEQLTDIVRRSAMLLKIPCSIDGAMEIAGRARGTPRSSPAAPGFWVSNAKPRALWKSHGAAGARPESPTACSSGCGILPMSWATVRSHRKSPTWHWIVWRSTNWDWTATTAACWR